MMEGRAVLGLAAFYAALPWLRTAPPGDGHPVIVLPGLGAPNGVSLLRCSLCAVHTREQLEHMIEVMTGIGRQMGVLAPKLRGGENLGETGAMGNGRDATAPEAGLAYGEPAARWVLLATVLGSSLTFVDATVGGNDG